MNLIHIIDQATDFGSFRSRNHFISFTIKMILYIFPAIILGHVTDITIEIVEKYQMIGNNIVYYILLQTIFIIITLYLFIIFLHDFTSEFQQTMAGGYFIVLYFGIQTNYIYRWKEFMNSLFHNTYLPK